MKKNILELLDLTFFGIKKEFAQYENEIKLKALILEQKNNCLEDLVSVSKRQSDKLTCTVILKEKLMAILSHDIRTPLNSFKLLIGNYEKGYITAKDLIEGIVETKKDLINLDKMVLDLLHWSKGDAEKCKEKIIAHEPYDEIIQSILSIYSLCAKNKKLEIISAIDIPDGTMLAISKRELEIILRNLLSNAIKFSHPEGKIIVSLSISETERRVAILNVKDFGVGMSPEKTQHLSSNKLTSSCGTLDEVGVGIGLSIVFDVINSNCFAYNIKSMLNEGTEFSIRIPLKNC